MERHRPYAISHQPSAMTFATSLSRDDEVSPAVLLPAGLVLVAAERLFLALADHDDAVCGHAEVHEIVLHRAGAARSKREVVLGAAARVAVPFDRDPRARPLLQPVGVFLQRRTAIVADLGL